MSKPKPKDLAQHPDALFDRIVTILEEARGRVVRAVNTGMVTAYWLIGREIVEAVQGGEERAEYGKQVLESLSERLTERYGKGFSERNLQVFRQFYLAFRDRIAIPHPMGAESTGGQKLHLPGGESVENEGIPSSSGRLSSEAGKLSPPGRELTPANWRWASPRCFPGRITGR
jgi:hypothetical protein